MKKTLTLIFGFILMIGMVCAVNNHESDSNGALKKVDEAAPMPVLYSNAKETMQKELREVTPELYGKGLQKVQEGISETFLESGKMLRFSKEGENLEITSGKLKAKCEDCNISIEDGKLKAKMSNGRNAEIKVLPETASLRAREQLQMNFCGNESNCSIQLKEVGKDNATRMAYEIEESKEARFLGLFKTKAKVKAQIDAETGELIDMDKPWWAFLKKEKLEEAPEDLE